MKTGFKNYFNGKTVCLTGAGAGMGREMALLLGHVGAKLFLCDYNKVFIEEVSSLLAQKGADFSFQEVDVSDEKSVTQWISQIEKESEVIDILINNAGIAGQTADLDLLTFNEMRQVIDINLWGAIHCTMKALPLMKKSSGGCIVNVSSLAGLAAVLGALPYTISKFAIRGFSEALTLELMENNISVCQIFPGVVKTNIVKNIPGFNGDNAELAQKNFNKQKGIMADQAAELILEGIAKNKKRILVGPGVKPVDILARMFPGTYFKMIYGQMKKIIDSLK